MKLTGRELVLNRPEAAGGLFCQVLGYEFDRHPEWKRSDCLEDRTEMDAGDSGLQFDKPFRIGYKHQFKSLFTF